MPPRTPVPLAAAAALAACGPRGAPAPAAPPAAGEVVVYACPGRPPLTARFRAGSVELDLAAHVASLARVAPAAGATYAGDGITLRAEGADAVLGTPGEVVRCRGQRARSPWEEARLRGAALRAVGQEPGWTLEVVPEPAAGPEATEYRTRAEAHTLTVRARRAPCQDVMSGEPFPLTVTVEVDGRAYAGCGREIPP